MKKSMFNSLILCGLMVASAIAAQALTPTVMLARTRPALVLDSAIPERFGEWKEDKTLVGSVINPATQEALNRIYTQTLSRTYINARGERIMLSVAYGGDQRDAVQLHYPEVCYPAQGFQLQSNVLGMLVTRLGNIPVKRLETNMGNQRFEPVTYWTTVGDVAVTGGIDKKLAEMRYGLRGEIPDGLLFRVSSISRESTAAFALHEQFARQMLDELNPPLQHRLFGL